MKASNDNQPPKWKLIAELHFLSQDMTSIFQIVSGLPIEQKNRFLPTLQSMVKRMETLHDIVEEKNDSLVN